MPKPMKAVRTLSFAATACVLWWVAALSGAGAQESYTELPASLVTATVLESKIAEAESATGLNEDAKAGLVELYRKALSHLEAARAHESSAADFRSAAENAPALIQSVRASLEPGVRPAPLSRLDADAITPLADLEQLLQKEQADLAAVEARRADFESRLMYSQQRPAAISQRLPEATQQREEALAKHQPAIAKGDTGSADLVQAHQWVQETLYMALSTEIKMLDQELLSQPLRVQLLEAKRDREEVSAEEIKQRIKVLNELIDNKRQEEAGRVKAEAERTQRETEGLDPVLVQLSNRNAALSKEVNTITAKLRTLGLAQERVEQLAERIGADYQDARETLESGEIAGDLGRILLDQRDALPNHKTLQANAKRRKSEIAELNVQRLGHRAEVRRIADTDATVDSLAAELQANPTAPTPGADEQKAILRDLVQQRQGQLEKALEANRIYLSKLQELDAAENRLLTTAVGYDEFLREHLLWLRSAAPTRLRDILDLPNEVRNLLVAAELPGLMGLIAHQLSRSVGFWFAIMGAFALLWRRQSLIRTIETVATQVGKLSTDRIGHTWRVLALTLLVAAPLPLLLAAAGWQLQVDHGGADLLHAIGNTLTQVALHLYILRTLHAICLPKGLAAAHFRWPERNLVLLRTQLDRLTWLLVPAILIVNLAIDLDPVESGGTLARLGVLLGYVALSWFLYQVFHPKRGVLTYLRSNNDYNLVFRTYPLWYGLAVGLPAFLIALVFTGYTYSATSESSMFVHTLWFFLALTLINALAQRWLQLTRWRLAYEAAMGRRRATQDTANTPESEAGGTRDRLQFEEPEVDIGALSEETRGLFRALIFSASVVGLYLIWSSALPALRIFDNVTLWNQTITVAGEEQLMPTTLGDLGLALVYALGAWILAARLPAMLEIILLQRFHLTAASRYTITTLVTYVIVAAGIFLVLGTLGARWSQLQWLAAALSLGIGFGLQEIVANFISGLIILFERPIRVGDAVTVGNTDGIVTKIKIRATTIRNWDGKELLVPNKEFITGHLLNWSLSDPTIRLVLAIGIAYGSPVRQAMSLLEEAASENENVLDDPAPSVIFESFGDNALGLALRCFIDSVDLRYKTISALNESINAKFNAAGISIAFPQRDLHLDTLRPLRIQIEGAAQTD